MSRSQFRRIWLILRLAWLNLQEESICYWQDQPVNYIPSDAEAAPSGELGFTELISQLTIEAFYAYIEALPATNRLLQYYLQPTNVDRSTFMRNTSRKFSQSPLWCRLEWKRVSQLPQTRTCSQAIDIQYHSDKDTTTLSFAESCDTFGCLLALRQPVVIIETEFHERS